MRDFAILSKTDPFAAALRSMAERAAPGYSEREPGSD